MVSAKQLLLQGLALCVFSLLLPAGHLAFAQNTGQNSEHFLTVSTDSSAEADQEPTNADLEKLLQEAQELFLDKRPIDGRTKALKALQIAPKNHRPHVMLGHYYLREVGHFRLALRYLRRAESLFEEKYGSDLQGTLDELVWREHARLLYLLAETRLNLDDYQGSLDTLDRFHKLYWDGWYPGTRAWVLMKLGRIDKAILVAQAGLIRGAEPGRTYNILGILLSLKGSRKLSLEAFGHAIRVELALGSLGQPATPLNNSGEVYRELFSDDMAEASWTKALAMPDACEHILPSLNLAILYIDELRLFQAERVLNDFEACFSSNSIRSDTEHRALLALARGRIALLAGRQVEALGHLRQAVEYQQWFGKIGTSESDLRFAAAATFGRATRAQAAVNKDTSYENLVGSLQSFVEITLLQLQSWWYHKRAREIAIDELKDLEDLQIRNTDAMVEYPTLGNTLAGFPASSLEARVIKMKEKDIRPMAHAFYDLYLATNLLENDAVDKALSFFKRAKRKFRTVDRLARAETLVQLIIAKKKQLQSFWPSEEDSEEDKILEYQEALFELLPSHIRNHDLALPVSATIASSDKKMLPLLKDLRDMLFAYRFTPHPRTAAKKNRYALTITDKKQPGKEQGNTLVSLILTDRRNNRVVAQSTRGMTGDGKGIEKLYNSFLDKVFSHKVDPPQAPLPTLELLESIL